MGQTALQLQARETLWLRAESCTSILCFTFSTEKVHTFSVGHMATKLHVKVEDNDVLAFLLVYLFCNFQHVCV